MSVDEQYQAQLCVTLQTPLMHMYSICAGSADLYVGLQLPTGEISKEFVLITVGPALIKRAQQINEDAEATGLLLVSTEVEQQVATNKFCLAVMVSTGPSSSAYYAYHECTLISKEQ